MVPKYDYVLRIHDSEAVEGLAPSEETELLALPSLAR